MNDKKRIIVTKPLDKAYYLLRSFVAQDEKSERRRCHSDFGSRGRLVRFVSRAMVSTISIRFEGTSRFVVDDADVRAMIDSLRGS
jgi:hypothetical protein